MRDRLRALADALAHAMTDEWLVGAGALTLRDGPVRSSASPTVRSCEETARSRSRYRARGRQPTSSPPFAAGYE